MKLLPSHLIDTAVLDLITGGALMETRRCLVWHFTSGATAKSSITHMRRKGLSAHVVIDRDGKLYQCRPFDRTCGHAGESRWRDPRDGNRLYVGCNQFSIGIEIANAGDDPALAKRMGGKTAMAKHWQDSRAKEWEIYPDVQLATVLELSKLLVVSYNLDDATGHEYVAPERKNDPGPLFPMKEFREACGFSGLPKIHRP